MHITSVGIPDRQELLSEKGSHQSLDKVDNALIEGIIGALTGHLQHTLHELLGICLRRANELTTPSQKSHASTCLDHCRICSQVSHAR